MNVALNPVLLLSRVCLKNNIDSTDELIKKLTHSDFKNSAQGIELSELLNQCINYSSFIGEASYEIE